MTEDMHDERLRAVEESEDSFVSLTHFLRNYIYLDDVRLFVWFRSSNFTILSCMP